MAPATKPATTAKSRTRQPKAKTKGQVSSTQHIISFSEDQPSYQLRDIPLSQITISEGHREPKNVADLAESIAQLGLMHPITVVAQGGEQYRCLAGANRITACQTLGWTHIPTHVVDFAGLQAEMAMIDENLMRNELTDLELAEHLHRRKAIYETLHEETKHGGKRRQDPDSGSRPRVPAFLDNAARITGRGRTTIGDYVQIAKHLDPEVKATLHHTPIANRKTDLLTLAKMEPEDTQRTIAHAIAKQGFSTLSKAVQTLRDTGILVDNTAPHTTKSLFDGTGLMGFLEDVKDYAYKRMEPYAERDILSHTFERRDDKVVLVIEVKHT